ncbi:MAG: hypothetical protein Q6359_06185 [Candidatus Brocadiales bacterium]|nr:hypothetical protein [Candidatus Brocadiales bacterium]
MQREDALETTRSIFGKTVLLTAKQWFHIVESHDYMAGNMDKVMETVNTPDYIVRGSRGELLAVKHYVKTNISDKHCVVAYKENDEGFVITAFMTSRPETIKDKGVIWQR